MIVDAFALQWQHVVSVTLFSSLKRQGNMSFEYLAGQLQRHEWSTKLRSSHGVVYIPQHPLDIEELVETEEELEAILHKMETLLSFKWEYADTPMTMAGSLATLEINELTRLVFLILEDGPVTIIARLGILGLELLTERFIIDLLSDNGASYNTEIWPVGNLPTQIHNNQPRSLSRSAILEALYQHMLWVEGQGVDGWQDLQQKTEMGQVPPPANDEWVTEEEDEQRLLVRDYLRHCYQQKTVLFIPGPQPDNLTNKYGRPLNFVERLARVVDPEATEAFVLDFLKTGGFDTIQARMAAGNGFPVGVDRNNELVKVIAAECARRHPRKQKSDDWTL